MSKRFGGVRLGRSETVLIGSLLLCCGSLPGGALAEDSTGAETRVVADYRIDLDTFTLGSFRFTTLLNGSDYRVLGDGHFSILDGLLYDLRTCPFRKFHPAWIRIVRQNHRIIESDVCDPARARNVCRRPVQVAQPA
jgi:hypothetical protein